MQNRRVRPGDWIFLAISPLLVFPVYLVVASLFDWFTGDAFLAMRILHDSRGQLLRELAADWIASLPLVAPFAWLLFLALYLVAGRRPGGKGIRTLLAGLLAGLMAGVWLYHADTTGMLVAGITGAVLGMCQLCWHWVLYRRGSPG